MKTKLKIVLLLTIMVLVLVFVVAQSAGNNTPSAVVLAYIDAYCQGDYATVEKLSTSEHISAVGSSISRYAQIGMIRRGKVTGTVEKIYGNIASVAVTHACGDLYLLDNSGVKISKVVILKKVDGKWKVDE